MKDSRIPMEITRLLLLVLSIQVYESQQKKILAAEEYIAHETLEQGNEGNGVSVQEDAPSLNKDLSMPLPRQVIHQDVATLTEVAAVQENSNAGNTRAIIKQPQISLRPSFEEMEEGGDRSGHDVSSGPYDAVKELNNIAVVFTATVFVVLSKLMHEEESSIGAKFLTTLVLILAVVVVRGVRICRTLNVPRTVITTALSKPQQENRDLCFDTVSTLANLSSAAMPSAFCIAYITYIAPDIDPHRAAHYIYLEFLMVSGFLYFSFLIIGVALNFLSNRSHRFSRVTLKMITTISVCLFLAPIFILFASLFKYWILLYFILPLLVVVLHLFIKDEANETATELTYATLLGLSSAEIKANFAGIVAIYITNRNTPDICAFVLSFHIVFSLTVRLLTLWLPQASRSRAYRWLLIL